MRLNQEKHGTLTLVCDMPLVRPRTMLVISEYHSWKKLKGAINLRGVRKVR